MLLLILLSSLLGSVFPFLHARALEQNYPSIIPITGITTLPELIKIIFNFSLAVGAILLFAMLLFGGVLLLISAGDPQKQRKAKERLGSAVLGSILLLTSYLAANIFAPELIILKPAGIPGISLTKTPLFAPQCSDGIDNDGDGKIDWNGKDRNGDGIQDVPADPNCQNAADESEFLVECSDGIDNDGDGKIDFPADPQCKELSQISESVEYECAEAKDPESGTRLPEITESFPLVTRAKQALATLDTIRMLLKDIRDRSLQIAQVEAQSVCQSESHDHGFDDCSGIEKDFCGASLGGCFSGPAKGTRGTDCAAKNACEATCEDFPETPEDEGPACIAACPSCINTCTAGSSGSNIGYRHNYNWSCHRAGEKWSGGGKNENVGALPPTSTPTLEFINETINRIERDEDNTGGIKKTLDALRDSSDPIKNPPYTLIAPREEDNDFLLSLKRIEDELKGIRDAMNICSGTPNEQVLTFKNIVARGVDAPEPCKDAGNCPEENDFVCLFLSETK